MFVTVDFDCTLTVLQHVFYVIAQLVTPFVPPRVPPFSNAMLPLELVWFFVWYPQVLPITESDDNHL
jgi:hypothetical protein